MRDVLEATEQLDEQRVLELEHHVNLALDAERIAVLLEQTLLHDLQRVWLPTSSDVLSYLDKAKRALACIELELVLELLSYLDKAKRALACMRKEIVARARVVELYKVALSSSLLLSRV